MGLVLGFIVFLCSGLVLGLGPAPFLGVDLGRFWRFFFGPRLESNVEVCFANVLDEWLGDAQAAKIKHVPLRGVITGNRTES